MKQFAVNVKTAKEGVAAATGSFTVELGENLEENVKLFGAEVVNTCFTKQAIIILQNQGRNMLNSNTPAADIQNQIAKRDLKARISSKSAVDTIIGDFKSGKMPREEALKKLAAMLA